MNAEEDLVVVVDEQNNSTSSSSPRQKKEELQQKRGRIAYFEDSSGPAFFGKRNRAESYQSLHDSLFRSGGARVKKIEWDDLCLSKKTKERNREWWKFWDRSFSVKEKILLDDVSGSASSGRLLAIMGTTGFFPFLF